MPDEINMPRSLDTSHGPLVLGDRCLVMGILNITPDSFSDGGRFVESRAAVARAMQIEAEGADLLDIGGESTRPGSSGVDASEQVRRIEPVIREARACGLRIPVSVDTRSAAVARAALDAGADMVNDVSGLRDDRDMVALVRERGVPFVVMHMQGTTATMQVEPRYDDVVREVRAFFQERADALDAAGVDASRMIVDPGIGFGKSTEHNLELLRRVAELRAESGVGAEGASGQSWPMLVGPSRKRFIGELLKQPDAAAREMGTAVAVAWCAMAGVEMVRVHDVRTMRGIVGQLSPAGR